MIFTTMLLTFSPTYTSTGVPWSAAAFIAIAVSTAWSSDFSSMPARIKPALSSDSGRSVEVRMHTAGKGCPTEVKNDDSSGSVPESEITAAAFIWRQL